MSVRPDVGPGPLPLRHVRRWLERDQQLPASPVDRATTCQGCGSSLPSMHRHVVDLSSRAFLCVCQLCWMTLPSGADSRHRAIPEKRARLPQAALDELEWDQLQIPVGIAFFFWNSRAKAVVGCYPSPAGPVESQLPVGEAPWLLELVPDVEALLVRRSHEARDSFVVPIDVAYELVGRVRATWSGFGARPEMDGTIDVFFRGLEREAGA